MTDHRACFWGGWGGSVVVVDMDAHLTVAYMMNKMGERPLGDERGIGLVLAAQAAVSRPGRSPPARLRPGAVAPLLPLNLGAFDRTWARFWAVIRPQSVRPAAHSRRERGPTDRGGAPDPRLDRQRRTRRSGRPW